MIDGLIAREVTLVYGQSEAGKSMLIAGAVAALIAGADQYLGCGVASQTWDCGILVGDYGDGRRYAERLSHVLTEDQLGRVRIYDPTRRGMPFQGWAQLTDLFRQRQHNLMVVDSLSAFIPGDINQGPACQEFFDYLTKFTARDVTVIVAAHSTEKRGQYEAQDFIGHSAIKQRPTWHCRVRKQEDRKVLRCHGNDGGDYEMTVSQADPAVPAFDVVEPLADARQRREKRKRERGRERKTKADQYREFVLGNCPDEANISEVARRLAAEFGGAEGTHRNRLRNGAYGIKFIDGRWQRPLRAV